MKNVRQILFSVLAIVAAGFIVSCSEDDGPTAALPTVVVTATLGDETTALSNGGDIDAGESVIFTINATAPGGFNTLFVTGSATATINRNDLNLEAGATESGAIVLDPIVTTAANAGQSALYNFVVVDELDQKSDTLKFSFNIVSPPVDTYEAFLLGGFLNSTTGSFYDAVENMVYTSADALMNPDKIDLLFYYADTPGYTIAAVDNPEADATIEAQTQGDLDNFTTQNPTRFKTFLTEPNFDNVATLADLESAFVGDAASSDQSRITSLVADQVFGFQLSGTRGEKIGLIKVVETMGTQGSDRAIRLEIKIEPTQD